ncbi:MAG: STAS domain-containing protein [Proteobacteria bacterium]|nr:STAS domain-containing protein [Pseudomonadota bacterium]
MKSLLLNIDLHEFEPKLFSSLRKGYTFELFKQDFIAALTVAIVALPLAMALAVASGTTPDKGFYTAIIGGFIIAALGGSRTQIGGPAAAFVVVVYNIIENHGYDGLLLATLMAGIMLVFAGFARLGSIVRYVPYAVLTGFTTGLAVVLFCNQLKDLFGLQIINTPADFIERWKSYFEHYHTFDKLTFIVGLGSIIAILVIRKTWTKVPVLLTVLALSSLIVFYLGLPIATLGSKFGYTSPAFPIPSLPSITLHRIVELFPSAFIIAFLAGIESLLCAVIADGITGDNHRPNIELIAQGFANILSALIGGIPATAAFARTATNIKAGAKTPFAGMMHAVLILFFMMFFTPLTNLIPLASLAAILVVVSFDMSEIGKFKRMLSAPRGDQLVLVSTFILTILFDLSVAIQVGIILSALVFMKRMSVLTHITPADISGASLSERDNERIDSTLPEGVKIYHINGPFFFGAASRLRVVLEKTGYICKVYILNLTNMPMIDTTGIQVLTHFIERCHKRNVKVILAGVNGQPREVLNRHGIYKVLPKKCLTTSLEQAVLLSKGMTQD